MIAMKKIKTDAVAYFLIASFVFFFTAISFGRHAALKSYLNDLGTYDQALWNTVHGNFFHLTSSMVNVDNYFGAHFSPILIFFVPFYFVFSSPKWLLFFQALAVGGSAVPVYIFAKEKLKSGWLGLAMLAGYLLYPALGNGLLYDFHEIVLAVFFAAWALYFLEKGNDKWFVVFAVLLALSQEHLPLIVFMAGLYIFFVKKRKKFGIAVSAVSLLYFFLVMAVLIPFFSSTGKPALIYSESMYPSRYAWLGSSFSEIAKNIFLHPLAILKVIFSYARMKYIFLLVAPVFSLALFSWPFWVALPILLIGILSSNPMTFGIFFYHSAIFAPFVFFSAILTFQRWFWDNLDLRRIFAALILVFSVGSGMIYGVSPFSTKYRISDYFPGAHAKNLSEVKKMIPSEASLSAQHNLAPHFSGRQFIYRFPLKKDEAEYILLDTLDPFADNPKQIFGFEYALQMSIPEWQSDIEELKKSEKYSLVFNEDGYLLFRKK